MTFSPHKGMDLAKICIIEWINFYLTSSIFCTVTYQNVVQLQVTMNVSFSMDVYHCTHDCLEPRKCLCCCLRRCRGGVLLRVVKYVAPQRCFAQLHDDISVHLFVTGCSKNTSIELDDVWMLQFSIEHACIN